jgi:hypothetical protein
MAPRLAGSNNTRWTVNFSRGMSDSDTDHTLSFCTFNCCQLSRIFTCLKRFSTVALVSPWLFCSFTVQFQVCKSYTIYQTDNGPKIATSIRTFVSNFVCHPVHPYTCSFVHLWWNYLTTMEAYIINVINTINNCWYRGDELDPRHLALVPKWLSCALGVQCGS